MRVAFFWTNLRARSATYAILAMQDSHNLLFKLLLIFFLPLKRNLAAILAHPNKLKDTARTHTKTSPTPDTILMIDRTYKVWRPDRATW
uniref:Uncharacterized protein n=1 Tax=Cupriavidus taiwanensis TaxID=164546 RepID=A0A375HEG7_9BURK|nr:protein of unknown function [Cupriavidus taiwanensis]